MRPRIAKKKTVVVSAGDYKTCDGQAHSRVAVEKCCRCLVITGRTCFSYGASTRRSVKSINDHKAIQKHFKKKKKRKGNVGDMEPQTRLYMLPKQHPQQAV